MISYDTTDFVCELTSRNLIIDRAATKRIEGMTLTAETKATKKASIGKNQL